ncbi:MAG: hypothetical protein JWP91_176 [Fibrobacteres bacterium]|nr:hypothetical protein [Fibrobacterota bacterium]
MGRYGPKPRNPRRLEPLGWMLKPEPGSLGGFDPKPYALPEAETAFPPRFTSPSGWHRHCSDWLKKPFLYKGSIMKALLSALCFGLVLGSSAYAQGKPVDPASHDSTGKAISATKYSDAMGRLPAGVAEKIAAAREAAKAAKADIDAMKSQGKTPEEIQAMITEKKAAALANLEKALDALNSLPDGAKERATKAKDVVAKRLEDRKADAKNP